MSIIGYSSRHSLLIVYDEVRLETEIGQVGNCLTTVDDAEVIESAVCRALYKERFFTSFAKKSKDLAISRMKHDAKLFGDFSISESYTCLELPCFHELTKQEQYFLVAVIDVFKNRGKTCWSFNAKKRGALRLYPSNGAIHALRPKLVLENLIVDYFPYQQKVAITTGQGCGDDCFRLEVIIEMSRIFEKYHDAAALAAMYIEFGHLLAVINEFVHLSVLSVEFVEFSKFTITFARG